MSWRQGLHRHRLGRWELELLPQHGGKVRSLRFDRGPNLLLEPPQLSYIPSRPGTAFDAGDASGWDECFPSVAPCEVDGQSIADHGTLWTLGWDIEATVHDVTMVVSTPAATLRRRFRREGDGLVAEYQLRSDIATPLPYLWSCHPLLKTSEGSWLSFPESAREAFVEWQHGTSLVSGTYAPLEPLKTVPAPSARRAYKLFLPRLSEGFCAHWDRESGQRLEFRFDLHQLPHLGVWICAAGWPGSGARVHHAVALEPCRGWPDSLAVARQRQQHCVLGAGEVQSWSIEVAARQSSTP